MRVFAKTDLGKARDINEDFYYIANKDDEIKLYILADGMGGYNGGEIASRLATSCVKSYIETNFSQISHDKESILKLIESGKAVFTPQDESNATHYPMIRKEDGLIDWNLSAEDIFNKMRGFTPWPSVYTYLDGKLFKILNCKAVDGNLPAQLSNGGVYSTKNSAFVKCSSGVLQLLQVQLEGKKAMDISSFMASGKLKNETVLGK